MLNPANLPNAMQNYVQALGLLDKGVCNYSQPESSRVEPPGYYRLMVVTETKQKRGAETLALLLLVILLKPFSNLFLAWGMKAMPAGISMNPMFYIKAMFEPLVALGMLMQGFWLLLRMKLLSLADLSFVLPVTAVGYVLTTLLGRVFLHEQVSTQRWIAVLLIFLGTAVVGSTRRVNTV